MESLLANKQSSSENILKNKQSSRPAPVQVHSEDPNHPPSKVEVVSSNDQIKKIIVTCSCGNQTTIVCQYE